MCSKSTLQIKLSASTIIIVCVCRILCASFFFLQTLMNLPTNKFECAMSSYIKQRGESMSSRAPANRTVYCIRMCCMYYNNGRRRGWKKKQKVILHIYTKLWIWWNDPTYGEVKIFLKCLIIILGGMNRLKKKIEK